MFYFILNIFPSSSKAAPSHIKNFQFNVLIRSSIQNKPSSWPMRSTSTVSRVIYQLEDIFRMHHPKRNNYSILHNEKCEKPRTEIIRRSYNVFPSPILKSPDLNNSTSMPTFAINTNLTKEKIPPNFVLDASKFIAERLGKPESVSVVNHWEQKKRVH